MSISNKLTELNTIKQDIKQAIENKGIPMTNIAFTEYANKIADISGGGGGGGDFPTISYDEIEYFGWSYYMFSRSNVIEQVPQAWQDMKDSETVLFDIPLELVAPNHEMGDLYVGTNEQLQELYDACANGTIPPPIDTNTHDVYYVNNVATFYAGDVSGDVDFPSPMYVFGNFGSSDDALFIVTDLTPLSMGLGLVLIKPATISIPNNNIVIQQGFEFENESGIIIPDSVTSIGGSAFFKWESNNQPLVIPNSVTSISDGAFSKWESNNQPLVIPNSVTSISDFAFNDWQSNNHPLVIPNSVISIGEYAFYNWASNNHPLVIPNSVTSIGDYGFYNWTSNNQPLVIPNSVTSISDFAFSGWSLVPYVEIQAITPPTLGGSNAFNNQNDAPIYVPDESVDDYKAAANWVLLADRIFPISEKP